MLKISSVGVSNHSVTLKLEGRVVGLWAEELARIAEASLVSEANLTLDMTEVSYVDQDGANLLISLRARGVSLLQLSPFVAEQLKASAKGLLK